jgi:hypothetical protein
VPPFEFTLFVEGVDLLSDRVQDAFERLGVEAGGFEVETIDGDVVGGDIDRLLRALRYRGSGFFEDVLFGREGDAQFAVFKLDAASEDEAVQWAAAMLTYACPGLRVICVQSGRHGTMDIR